jgi:muramoyltetrapeptide carboxypeptidase
MTTYKLPAFLKPNDTIGVVATARWIDDSTMALTKELFANWGFQTKFFPHVGTKSFQLAGSDQERRDDLQAALNDPEIAAIVIARGGYGTVRVLEGLDWTVFQKHPKWICGYSDITILHAHLSHVLNIASVHSTMPISFPHATPLAMENLRSALLGNAFHFEWPCNSSIDSIVAPLVGGNLSVLYSALGSREQLNGEDAIVFIEDVDEMLYHIDRMFMALLRAGTFNGAKAVVAGGFTLIKDNTPEFGFEVNNPWGKSVANMLEELSQRLGIPVLQGMQAGHMNDNRAFYLGANAKLTSNNGMAVMSFPTLNTL